MIDFSIEQFGELLGERRRAWFVFSPENQNLVSSDPALARIAAELSRDARDFDHHEAIFLEFGRETGALFGAFLHKTIRGQGAGGVRHWRYDSLGAFLKDGLRLSRGMGRKNALAGLYWGGGKGIIARANEERYADAGYRRSLYREYGQFITSLRGAYVTAEDVGTTSEDMADIFATTRFVTCIPRSVGGSGNPSPWTARGVVCAMEGALAHRGMGDLAGKRIAMQGTGNVGSFMIDELLARGVSGIVASEISAAQADKLRLRYASAPVDIRLVTRNDTSIFGEKCDVFAPNALGGVLQAETIGRLDAAVVCGAANNQLLDDRRDDALLRERGITLVPDFVANRMGIVNCANEQYGNLEDDPLIFRHFDPEWDNSVYAVTRRVLARAEQDNTTPTRAANALADELSGVPHPIFGHRAWTLIQFLVRLGWHDETP